MVIILTLSASSIQVCLQLSSSMPIPVIARITACHAACLVTLLHILETRREVQKEGESVKEGFEGGTEWGEEGRENEKT